VILYRHAPPTRPFIWETADQPEARWHGRGEGPAHYLADTPDGAWAELLRHEEITAPEELAGIQRAIWAIEVPDAAVEATAQPALGDAVLLGCIATYPACQGEARRLRDGGAAGLRAPSAALMPGGARGWRVDGGLQPAPPRNGTVIVLFGSRTDLVGWRVVEQGRPGPEVLERVRPLTP
jgi:RES domain-containing protein